VARFRQRLRLLLGRVQRNVPDWALPSVVRIIDALDVIRRGVWRFVHRGPPIPRWSMRRRVGSPTLANYVEVRRRMADDLEGILERAGYPLRPGVRVLDWGCGSGRVALQLLERQELDLHGCDVDPEAIEWLRRVAPGGEWRFRVSGFAPPLSYPDDSFDVVYAASVFTHLNQADQLAWLRELKRLLAPEGAALLTTAGPHAFSRPYWRDIPAHTAEELAPQLGRLDELGFVYASYSRDLANRPQKYPGISGDYGLSFQSEAWTRQRWSEVLEIDQVLPAAVGGYQDAVVATRR